ncbi:MAG TPA: hypothetical protein PKA06_16090 [Gemmatales bacterium]|nr:hypothetical protein [Gemmatales bacterium]
MSIPIRVVDVQLGEESFRYRTPIKFGGVALDKATILHAHVVVEDQQGRQHVGFGSMPMGNIWAFPSRHLSYEKTLQIMLEIAEEAAQQTREYQQWGHPLEIGHALEPIYRRAALERSQTSEETPPILAVMVACSPIDAAIHDAIGIALEQSAFQAPGVIQLCLL